ncbi:MAG: hypothetical protein FWC79_05615 [Oscillospiraceae bacterium]|nr:hypothetical protein [Oscillospiraceae bacterium]
MQLERILVGQDKCPFDVIESMGEAAKYGLFIFDKGNYMHIYNNPHKKDHKGDGTMLGWEEHYEGDVFVPKETVYFTPGGVLAPIAREGYCILTGMESPIISFTHILPDYRQAYLLIREKAE